MNIAYWENDDFCDFLRHLVTNDGYTTGAIIDVVEKPYKWKSDYLEWTIEKGKELEMKNNKRSIKKTKKRNRDRS